MRSRELLRIGLVGAGAGSTALLAPISAAALSPAERLLANLGLGAGLGILAVGLAALLDRSSPGALGGGLAGLLLGAAAAAALARLVPTAAAGPVPADLLRPLGFLFLVLVGTLVGATRGSRLSVQKLRGLLREEPAGDGCVPKVLDTSVIIDGRIADICETGFLDGRIVIPQFVLLELQAVADSSDNLKRNRGRKGLDVLQRLQRQPALDVEILEVDFPEVPEVDQKLMALARRLGGKIVTNDFNLNQVAQVRGIPVLNINDLANSLRPVVLPGETMKLFILKEGKEERQGVAYLDDGTMVVVDNARDQIGRTVEITVTSVLQTTVGKMFFARYEPAGEAPAARRGVDRERTGRNPG